MKHKVVQLDTAGTLQDFILSKEYFELTSIQIEGPIDSRDFAALRKLVHLTNIDMWNTTIESYKNNRSGELPMSAFSGCLQLEKIVLPRLTIAIGEESFHNCIQLQSIHIPTNLKQIHTSAFYKCEKLNYILLPENLAFIGQWAFAGCKSLNNIILKTNKLIELEPNSNVFWGVNKDDCVVWVSEKLETAYLKAHQWSSFINFNQRMISPKKKTSFFFKFRPMSFQIKSLVVEPSLV